MSSNKQKLQSSNKSSGNSAGNSLTVVEKINPKLLFSVASLVILTALAASVIYVFFHEDRTLNTYVVVIVLLFFALSTASSLLFANSSQFEGNLMGFTITIIGPAALWFTGMLLFFYLLPPKDLFPPPDPITHPLTIESIGEIVSDMEARLDWNSYADWKKLQGTVDEIFDENESNTLRNLLSGMFEANDLEKVKKPHITTLFAYFDQAVVKIQRIQGSREGAKAYIRFKSRGTDTTEEPKSAFFIGDPSNGRLHLTNSFSDVSPRNQKEKGFEKVSTESVDCMIITLYDDPTDEDYLIVNMKRFSRSSNKTPGIVDLAVVSLDNNKPIRKTSIWEMKPSLVFKNSEVPLVFHQVLGAERGPSWIHDKIHPWLQTLEDALRDDDIDDVGAKGILDSVLKEFQNVEGGGDSLQFTNIHKFMSDDESIFRAYHLGSTRYAAMMLVKRKK